MARRPYLWPSVATATIRLIQSVYSFAELREVARDARIRRFEHREALQNVERAREIAIAAVDAGEVDEHARDDLSLGGRCDHGRLEHRVGRGGLAKQLFEIGRRERATARVRIEEQPGVFDRDAHEEVAREVDALREHADATRDLEVDDR